MGGGSTSCSGSFARVVSVCRMGKRKGCQREKVICARVNGCGQGGHGDPRVCSTGAAVGGGCERNWLTRRTAGVSFRGGSFKKERWRLRRVREFGGRREKREGEEEVRANYILPFLFRLRGGMEEKA